MMVKEENLNDSYEQVENKPHINGTDQNYLRKMFLGGLTPATNEDMLLQFYSQFGDIEDAVVMRDTATKRSRGFGFVTFTSKASVDKAQAARPHVIDGRTVDSKRALPRTESMKRDGSNMANLVRKIFVGGLKDYHDEDGLKDHFQQFGKVVSINILMDKVSGRKRGFAFVEFDNYDAVERVLMQKTHTINFTIVDVKKSNYKQVQAKRLATQQQPNIAVAGDGYVQGAYNQSNYPPTAYTYASTQAAPYGNWAYAPVNVQYTQQQAAYNNYDAPLNNTTAQDWNAYTSNGWGQYNSYTTSASTPNGWNETTLAAQNGYAAPAVNGWNGAYAQGTQNGNQAFGGTYQQAYNGGPQKSNNLQGNRMNPYGV